MILGIVLLALELLLPGWFWVVHIIQAQNIGGAAGDIYVTFLIFRMPQDTLVNDTGVSMRFYSADGPQ